MIQDFFLRACNGPFKEALNGKMSLPEEKPEGFHFLVHYVKYNTILVNMDADTLSGTGETLLIFCVSHAHNSSQHVKHWK